MTNHRRINRIRLEFKDVFHPLLHRLEEGINRIRLEFKVKGVANTFLGWFVLIESDWNLKTVAGGVVFELLICINRIRLEFKVYRDAIDEQTVKVLIESDWNLKFRTRKSKRAGTFVLIESDWNLKILPVNDWIAYGFGINRIRLEFKDNEKNRPPVALKAY